MPLYRYQCEKCGNAVELMRRMDERNDPVWCMCGRQRDLRIEPTGVVVKDPAVPRRQK